MSHHESEKEPPKEQQYPVKWYRSTSTNITILGLCNLAAPGIWSAMNSLGAGGAARPELINTANSLTFCLMVVSCYFSSAIVRYIGIKGALTFGTVGFAPFAAGLYANNRFGNEWFVIVGAAICGISAGVFWMAEAAIAIAYPEPWKRGRAIGYWLTYRLGGQIIGGAINLGLNAQRNSAGQVSYNVFLFFIAIQATGPLIAIFLSSPDQVQRKDGKRVELAITQNWSTEIRETTRLFFTPKFLLLVLWIGQAVFSEAVFFTYIALWFSVRSRALASLLSGIFAIIAGNGLGYWLDSTRFSLKVRSRGAFWTIAILQGAWWAWATINVTRFREIRPTYDWVDQDFGQAFVVFLLLAVWLQLNYMFLYFFIHNLSRDEPDIIRYAALLRGTESAWQAVAYGLSSLTVFGEVGGVYMNFSLWALSIYPAWLVLRHFGSTKSTSFETVGVSAEGQTAKGERGVMVTDRSGLINPK
ncbi:hypothetical protein MCOR25_010574 [Pyricularia grisea]|uniref:DUF895 domain membrane protein n=1 Tax=Pyricularia grisea TaxID=148305 RepID=A0A6P8BLX1_PYRGI|nr:uncharacterized protein PgNI_02461 [Pyricularia grisea]KAI6350233.1 hypothetical protein MCOR25_010574 [Pyricularia grisea]TLD17813.1 hypothetical protein PgNI_02461 [Pyricularia grisea]